MRRLFRWFNGFFPIRKFRYGSAGPVLLAVGDYWYDGDAVAAGLTPHEGQGWILTTRGTDGLAGDETTRENATGNTISWLKVRALSNLTGVTIKARYNAGCTDAYGAWNGASFDVLDDLNDTLWGAHVGFAFESRTAEFNPVSTTAMRVTLQADTGIGISDIRE